jgi:hypothetical protein
MDSAALFVVYVVSISEVLCNANGAWSSNVLGLILIGFKKLDYTCMQVPVSL